MLRGDLNERRRPYPPHLLNSAQDVLELSPYRVVNAAELMRHMGDLLRRMAARIAAIEERLDRIERRLNDASPSR